MAQTNNDMYVNVNALVGIGNAQLNANDLVAAHNLGQIQIVTDSFGLRMFRYGKTGQSGGQGKGELCARIANVTGTVTAAAGEVNSTTQLADTTNWATNDSERGKICVITDDAGGAGAAPEGEVAAVVGNTASHQFFDPNFPLTTAPAASDTYANFATAHHDDAADGDLAVNVLGLLMADRTADYFGWLQFYGIHPGALFTTSAVTAGNPVVADAAAVGPHGCDTEQLWVGYAPIAVAADLASPFRSLVFIDVLHMSQPIA